MEFRWEDGALRRDGETVARTEPGFWGRAAAFEVDGERWTLRTERDALGATGEDGGSLRLDDRRLWPARRSLATAVGELDLVRTTSLFGALCFDLEHDGERIGRIAPHGPWRYRPGLDADRSLDAALVAFLLWAASRIDGRRITRIPTGGGMSAQGG